MATAHDRFERLFADHYAAVLAYALRRASRELAEDAVGETFLAAWRRLDELPEDALPWLYGTARKALANQRRGERRRRALIDQLKPEATAVAEDLAPSNPVDPRVLSALKQLAPKEREAVLLTAWDGLDPKQASAAAGCSAATMRVRLHRGRQRLVAALQHELPEPHGSRATMEEKGLAP